MENSTLTLYLLVAVCVGCLLLCAIIIYLCVMLRRIRRDVDELIRNKDANHISLEDMSQNKESVDVRKRTISSNLRYTGDPLMKRKRRHHSSIYSEPGEPVIFMERNDSQSNAGSNQQLGMEHAVTIQNPTEVQATPQPSSYQYSNVGFSPESTRNSTVPDSVSDIAQPIYGNEVFRDEKPPGKNNNQLNLFTKTSACSRFRNSRESADMRKRVAKKHVELAFGVPFLFVPTLLYESLEQATKILGS